MDKSLTIPRYRRGHHADSPPEVPQSLAPDPCREGKSLSKARGWSGSATKAQEAYGRQRDASIWFDPVMGWSYRARPRAFSDGCSPRARENGEWSTGLGGRRPCGVLEEIRRGLRSCTILTSAWKVVDIIYELPPGGAGILVRAASKSAAQLLLLLSSRLLLAEPFLRIPVLRLAHPHSGLSCPLRGLHAACRGAPASLRPPSPTPAGVALLPQSCLLASERLTCLTPIPGPFPPPPTTTGTIVVIPHLLAPAPTTRL